MAKFWKYYGIYSGVDTKKLEEAGVGFFSCSC